MGNLYERLRELRGNESQTSFAKRIGTKQTTYSAWERGEKAPPANSIALICKACGVSSDYLLGLSDDPKAARAVSIENGSANAVNSAHAHIETTVPQCRDCPHLARLLDLLAKGKRNA